MRQSVHHARWCYRITGMPMSSNPKRRKSEEVQALKDQMSKMQEDLKQYDTQTTKVKEYMDAMGFYIERQKEQQDFREREQKKMVETLDMVVPGWREPYFRERHKLGSKGSAKTQGEHMKCETKTQSKPYLRLKKSYQKILQSVSLPC